MQHLSSLGLSGGARCRGWLALLWLLCGGTAAMGQTATIGATAVPVVAPATSSYFYGPLYRSSATSTFNWSRYAHLYTPGELGIAPGSVITQLAWLKSDAGSLTGSNVFSVQLANTALSTLGTTQTWGTLTTGATQVYASTTQQVSGAAGDYFSVTLSQPFVYTGGNLLVLSDHEKQGTASGVISFVTNAATGYALGNADAVAPTATTSLTAASYGNRRPTLRVTFTPGAACTTPPTAGTTLASATTACPGTTVSLSLQGASFGAGQTYQWQVSTNGTAFTDIAGATGAAYTSGPLVATRTYRAVLTCGGQSATSAPATVTVAPVAYAALPVLESFEGTWADVCATHDAPTNSWRNSPETGNNAWRRDDDGATAAWTSPTVGVYSPLGSQGARSARFHSYYAGAATVGTLDLYADLSAAGNKVLQFDYLNTAGNDSLQVQVSTDGGVTFGAPLLRLGISGSVALGWQPQSVGLTSTSATTVVRFRTKVTTTSSTDIGLDNVRVGLLTGVPTCATTLAPAAGATAVARNTSLSWQPGTGVTTGYDVYIGTAPTPPLLSSNQVGTSYTPAALLAPNTTYYYQVVPRNANGPAVGCGVQSFTTNSVPVYCNPSTVYLSGFCGSNNVTEVTVGGSGLNATALTCSTVTTSLGTSAYTSYPVAGSTTGTLLQGLTYPITVSNNGSSILSVWVDYNQNGTFEASEWTQIATNTTANTAVTVNLTVPANAVLGLAGLRVRSRGTGNANAAGDACSTFGGGETKDFVVTIGAAPACAPPTGLTATNISTTSATLAYGVGNGTATNYSVQYGLSGFTPGGTGSTTVSTTALSVPLAGLTANTSYQFYVTKNCGGGTFSQAAGPFTFTTLCLAPVYATLPVLQSFENTWVNGCDTRDIPNTSWRNSPVTGDNSWRREDDGPSGAWVGPTSYAYSPTGSQGAHSARFHSGQASNGLIGTLDLFVNLSAAGAKRLSFDYLNTSGTDSLVVQLSTDGGVSFSRLAGYNQSGTVATGFVTQVLPIGSTSATAVIRFRGRADFGVTDIGLDNIVLESATGCLTPASLTATTTTTTAALSWLTGGTGTYTVVYGPTGFNPATGGTTVAGLTAPPYTITGLTPGTTYQFYITLNCAAGATSGTAGPQSFTTQILNDEPCGAVTLAISNTCTPLATTTFGATTTASTVYGPGGQGAGCGSVASPRDVWFKFTTAATGPTSTQVRISVTGGAASVARAYSGTACTGPLTYVLCAGTASNTAAPNLDLTGLAPSTSYYVRVNEYGTTGTLGNFGICATPVPNCPTPTGLAVGTLTNTTAAISWSAPVTAGNTFTVIYGPTGFDPATGGTALAGITAQSATLTGLTGSTAYQFYVQQVCGGFNGSSTLSGPFTFTTPLTAPTNDEPCGAVALGGGVVNGSNVGSTTSVQNGINLPACTSAQAPKDVWFSFTPTGTSTTFTISGPAAGMMRVYTTPDCAAGPFSAVFCAASAGSNTAFAAPVVVSGLTAGQRYYLAVSGYGSSDTPGAFTLSGTSLLAAKAQANPNALLVYPNPSNTGQLTLRLSGLSGAGRAVLLNVLGQVVIAQALSGSPEQTLATRGLATGIYTLRVSVAGQVLTRKVVLE